MFTDKQFKPDPSSLGNVGGDEANKAAGKSEADVVWLRAGDFAQKQKETMQLFGERVDARDICQGALGDCWLLAAMACLAEHEGAIESLFYSREHDPRGKYKLRLFNGVKETWESVVVDDFVPCDAGAHARGESRPLFSQPNGNQLWAILLEKAFAKFCGSYANLEGGHTIWALRAMTGDYARMFKKEINGSTVKFARVDFQNVKDPKDKRKSSFLASTERKNTDEMFTILKRYHQFGSVLCASGASGVGGLHNNHAYSILALCKAKEHRLVKIRNPWGTGEWKGAWGDGHENWSKYPEVAKAVGYQNKDDGAFWMSWEDFVENWASVGVIDRTIDVSTLRYKVDTRSKYPALKGCVNGCFKYWCRCWGCRRLYCPHRSSEETINAKQCCFKCRRGINAA